MRTGPVLVTRLLALCLLLSTPVGAQVIEGRVVEADEGEPAPGVSLQLTDLNGVPLARAETDWEGAFELVAPVPGEFLVVTTGLGYRPVRGGVFEVGPGGRIQIEIRLQIDPLGLDELDVEVAEGSSLSRTHPLIANGFVERARSGRGRFLTPMDIERFRHLDLPMLLQQTGRFELYQSSAGRVLGMRRGTGLCDPLFVIDDLPLTRGVETWASLSQAEILGVEVYRSAAEAPIEFQRYDYEDCGIVLVWTRR